MIHVERQGRGPALVLVHGITESHHSFDPLLDALSHSYDVTSIDLRGHGDSTREAPYDVVTMALDLRGVLESEGLNDAVLVGHSLGGTVVSVAAALGPVRGVVNVDQSMDLASFQVSLRALEPMLRGDQASFEAAMAMVFDAMRGPLSDEEWARLSALRRYDQEVVLAIWDGVFSLSEEDLAAMVRSLSSAISVPYLSLHGTDPGAHYEMWLAELVPSAAVERWEGCGHYPHLVDPDRFLARLETFVAGL